MEKGARVAALDRTATPWPACAPLGDAVVPVAARRLEHGGVAGRWPTCATAGSRVDILVNNAGIVRDATLGSVTDEDCAPPSTST